MAVGLFYRESYFRQRIGRDGWQHRRIRPVAGGAAARQPALTRPASRSSSRSAVARDAARAGVEIDVGRNKLFLLDTDVDGNSEENRQLAARLYFGDQRIRIRQELLLGVGGARCARPASTGAGCT